jgi:hypothetical protein
MQNLGDNTIPHTGSILMGTVDGSIKLITQIKQVSIFLVLILWYTNNVLKGPETRFLGSVAKGPKFRPQNTKGAGKKCTGPGKSGAEISADFSKKGRKGAYDFVVLWFCLKMVLIWWKIVTSQ